jgi:hypothetical protein
MLCDLQQDFQLQGCSDATGVKPQSCKQSIASLLLRPVVQFKLSASRVAARLKYRMPVAGQTRLLYLSRGSCDTGQAHAGSEGAFKMHLIPYL